MDIMERFDKWTLPDGQLALGVMALVYTLLATLVFIIGMLMHWSLLHYTWSKSVLMCLVCLLLSVPINVCVCVCMCVGNECK